MHGHREGEGERVLVSDHAVEHGMLVLIVFHTLFCRKDFVDLDWRIQTKHLGPLPAFETRNSNAGTIFIRVVENAKDMIRFILGFGVDRF